HAARPIAPSQLGRASFSRPTAKPPLSPKVRRRPDYLLDCSLAPVPQPLLEPSLGFIRYPIPSISLGREAGNLFLPTARIGGDDLPFRANFQGSRLECDFACRFCHRAIMPPIPRLAII